MRVLFRDLQTADPDELDYLDLDPITLPSYTAIRLSDRDEKTVTPDDVLTQNQIAELIEDAVENARDRAMIAFLADTGIRIAGTLSLRVCDVDLRDDGEGGRYTMNQEATGLKKDEGTKPITWSAAHLENYLYGGEHPRPEDNAAPLIHKSEGWEDDPDDDGSMTPARVRQRLRSLVESEDISVDPEDLSPHLFRHTAVSIWAKQGFSDREIKHRAGWSRDSDMLDKYEHIEDETINQQVLERYGIDVEDDGIGEPELGRCPRCSAPLQGGENYCPRCSAGLTDPGPDRSVEEVIAEQLREMPSRMLRGDKTAYLAALDGAGKDDDAGPTPDEMREIVEDIGRQVVRDTVDREHRDTLLAITTCISRYRSVRERPR